MKMITHSDQKKAWEREHTKPSALVQMDQEEASGGVQRFFNFLTGQNFSKKIVGLEMCCGKGRNVIWLASQSEIRKLYGFDFSSAAISEAKKRAKRIELKTDFQIADATKTWPYQNDMFDFGIDCFASTDIETKSGRDFANQEFLRVLKPGGYLFVYALSTDDEFHKMMTAKSPTNEKGAFINPLGKFEKSFTESELMELHKDFNLITKERVSKKATFFGKQYQCYHHWLIFQKHEKEK